MSRLIGKIVIFAFAILGIYVGLWVMFINPISTACAAYDAGLLTGMLIGKTIIMCVFAGPVGGLIAKVGAILGGIIMY